MDTLVYSLGIATWLHDTNGHRGGTAIQKWADCQYILLASSETQNLNKDYPINKKETADSYGADSPGEGPVCSWQIEITVVYRSRRLLNKYLLWTGLSILGSRC